MEKKFECHTIINDLHCKFYSKWNGLLGNPLIRGDSQNTFDRIEHFLSRILRTACGFGPIGISNAMQLKGGCRGLELTSWDRDLNEFHNAFI